MTLQGLVITLACQVHSHGLSLRSLTLLICGMLAGGPGVAMAQGQLFGAIRGTITDQQGGVLPGATVTATPRQTLPPQTVTSDTSGFYVLRDLAPGEYDITVELSGFAPLRRSAIHVRAGLSLSLDLQMLIGSFAEITTVRRDSPLLETSSATTAVNISGDLQRAVPLSSRRNWSDFFLLTPGTMSTESAFGGLTFNFYLHGAGNTSHVLQIDGADLSSASSAQPFYIAMSTEAIADVQIKTGAVDASSPLGQGAVVNVATKTGSNQLRGAATLLMQPSRWNDSNVPNGTSQTSSTLQPEVALGGPLWTDHAWAFGTYRRVSSETGVSRSESELRTFESLDPDYVPRASRDRANLYFFKANARLGHAHQLEGFLQHDKYSSERASAAAANLYAQTLGGLGASTRVSSAWSKALTTQVAISYNNKRYEIPPPSARPGPSETVCTSVAASAGRLMCVGSIGILGAPLSSYSFQPSRKLTFIADADYYLQNVLGTHTVRTGLYLQPRMRRQQTSVYINGGLAVQESVLLDPSAPSAGRVPFHQRIYDTDDQTQTDWSSSTTIKAEATDAAFYIQDTWVPLRKLSVTAGVRVDHIRTRENLLALSTQTSTEIGPRIGAVLAIGEDARRTVRAAWGRVHAGVEPPVTAVFGIRQAGFRDIYDLDLNGSFETTFVTPGSTRFTPNILTDGHLHQPFVDDASAGYRQQFPGSFVVDLNYLHRRFSDLRTTVDVNGIYEGDQFLGYRNPAQNQIYLLANNDWNHPVVTSLEASVTRQSSRFKTLASYSRQWRHIAGTWQPADPAAIIQPDAFLNSRGIGSTVGNLLPGFYATSLSLQNMGISSDGSQWRDHIVRLGAVYEPAIRLVAAINYAYQSGSWSGPIFKRLTAPDPRFGPPTVVLSNGRSVSNPLADTLRFVGPTRTDGQFRLPSYHALNVSVGYTFQVGPRRLSLSSEVFNAVNHDADQGLRAGGTNQSDPNFGLGTNRQRPRAAQLTARFEF